MTEKNEVAVKNEYRDLDDYLKRHWDISCNMLQKFRMILFTLRMLDSRFVMKPVGVYGKPSKPSILFGYEDGIYETDTKKALLVCVRTECLLYGITLLRDILESVHKPHTDYSSVFYGLEREILDDNTDITKTLGSSWSEEYLQLHNEFNQYCLLNFGFEPGDG